ncbi:MAG: hypothetical protein WB778_02880 [Thermoplasmata archaeon]
MTGSGGMGSLPSSRITRILQEKAESLKKRRQSAEAVLKEAQDEVHLLETLSISLPEVSDRESQIKDLVRKTDWDGVEVKAKSLLEYVHATAAPAIDERLRVLVDQAERLKDHAIPLPEEVTPLLAELEARTPDRPLERTIEIMARASELIRSAQAKYFEGQLHQARALGEWAGLNPQRLAELDKRLEIAAEPLRTGGVGEALVALNEAVTTAIPEAATRRDAAHATAEVVLAAAKDLGVPTATLESAIRADRDAQPLGWSQTVPALETTSTQVAESLRERVGTAIESLLGTLPALKEYGIDPAPVQVIVEEARARLSSSNPTDIPKLLADARAATEEPVVTVVAGLLDEVRPKIVEARRMGRDPSEVFSAMNRAREALRLKIYSEAIAASQEAIDRVAQLTEELETARDEYASLDRLLQRLATSKFAVDSYRLQLARIRTMLDQVEGRQAREALKELVRQLGRDAYQFYLDRWNMLDRVVQYAKERGFLPTEVETDFPAIRAQLDAGEIAEAGERLALAEVQLRAAAGPYTARRIEEIDKGFAEIPNPALAAPVRRLLADADVNLRVREDLSASVESLRKAEREFSAVFASHASSLVEALEEERRSLEAMGGAGDEIQRQIDEVQQIFNMGDFVKASRASQEIRTRAHQQQLLRGEEAVSHAKLALVELETMGLDLTSLRSRLDQAQEAAHAGRYAEAYEVSHRLEESTQKIRTSAQTVLEMLNQTQEIWQALRQQHVAVEDLRVEVQAAREAYRQLDFETAEAALAELQLRLRSKAAKHEAQRLLSETELLVEDGRRLAMGMEAFTTRFQELRVRLGAEDAPTILPLVQLLDQELIALVRPVLEENLRHLERDFDIARGAGIDVAPVHEPLAEARRRMSQAVPIGVEPLIEKARSQLTESRGFVEHAERVAKRAREAVQQADILHVEVAPLRHRLEQLEIHFTNREYARVIELGGALERDVLQATNQQVSKTLASFQGMITRVRHAGTDTTLPENLLSQARAALDEGRPVEALQLAAKSEGELERVDLQYRVAQGSLEAGQRALEKAEQDRVIAPLASEEIAKAHAAFKNREYPLVLELTLEASDLISYARESHRRAREAVDAAERQLVEATQLGANIDEVQERLTATRRLVEQGLYAEATRRAREAAEMGRWAIERLYAGAVGDLRRLIEAGRAAGLTTEIEVVQRSLDEAEGTLQARDWRKAAQLVESAQTAARQTIQSVVDGRRREVAALYERSGAPSPLEATRREEFDRQLAAARDANDLTTSLELLNEEARSARVRWRADLDASANALKDHLWVGEKLGLDTTPVMQTFSEAKQAIESGHLESVPVWLTKGNQLLEELVRGRLETRLKEVRTEFTFAREGLRVAVEPVDDLLKKAEELQAAGAPIEAARQLLAAEEDLSRRKALHRELLNLHYLIDAAIARALERKLDVSRARLLLEESIRLREQDYGQALERAREAHHLLQDMLKTNESVIATTATGFWPFKKPPAANP